MKNQMLMCVLAMSLVAGLGCPNKKTAPDEDPKAEQPTTASQEPADEEPTGAATETPDEGASRAVKGDLEALDPAKLTETAPDKFQAQFETTAGDFVVEVNRDWAPNGADRFYNLVKAGYYQNIAAFRVVDGFMAQFGIHGDPAVNEVWREAKIKDDPRKPEVSNKRGYVTYAMAGPDTRTVQLFISYRDNSMLDNQGFTPFGQVQGEGMAVVDKFYKGYGEGAPRGKGPNQMLVQTKGNEYLQEQFPELSYIENVTIISENGKPVAAPKKAAE